MNLIQVGIVSSGSGTKFCGMLNSPGTSGRQISSFFVYETRTTNVVRNAGCARSRYTQNFF